jgi:hypothetical protein
VPTLYHYTRQESFISLLSKRTFWVSNVRHFSDYSEIEYAYDLLWHLVSERSKEPAYGLEQGFLKLLLEEAKPEKHADSYVLCFSTKFDDLNQWRSYASPGLGYCIGFKNHALEALAERHNGRIGRCVYSRKSQEQIVSALLVHALRDLSTYFPYYGKGEINEGLAQARSKVFIDQFSSIAPLFKNPAFAEESEVRLIFDSAPSSIPIHFRSGLTSIVPYIEIEFQITDLYALSPETVMVKTCSRPEFVAEAARKFLTHSRYENVPVNSSIIPYREGL